MSIFCIEYQSLGNLQNEIGEDAGNQRCDNPTTHNTLNAVQFAASVPTDTQAKTDDCN